MSQMEGVSVHSMKQKGKAKAANLMSKDEPMHSLNKVAKTGSSRDAGENTPLQNQPSHVALVNSGGGDVAGSAFVSISNPPPTVAKEGGETSREKPLSYPCRYCKNWFSTAQALGGHQNTHRHMREHAKRQRAQVHTSSNSSLRQPPLLYPNYGGSPNSLSFGHPKLPLFNSNFILPMPPFRYSHDMLGLPAKQLSDMSLKNRQLPVFNRSRMIRPNTVTSGSFNFGVTVVGGQGGSLEGFGSANATINSMNSRGIVSCNISSVGFEATGTSRVVVRNFFGVSKGESNVRGHDESDGTIDLLSRVGMGRREDEESKGKGLQY